MGYLNSVGQFIAPYLSEIATALITCCLVVFGNEINNLARKLMRNQHFIIRTIVFILINAFGYGLIIVKLTPYLSRTLNHVDRGIMLLIVTSSFIVIGLWAQKNRHI